MIIDIHSRIDTRDGSSLELIFKDMEEFDITKRVISSFSNNQYEANENINDIVNQYPNHFIGCGIIDPTTDKAYENSINMLKLENIKMIEFDPVRHAYFPDLVDNIDKILEKVSENPIPVKIFTGIGTFGIPQQWEKYVEKYRNIDFIFLHMGCFDYGYTCVDVVARNENAYLEISNQYELQILRKAFDKVSMNKIFFGTTYPERLTSSALKILDNFEISSEDKRKILGGNAKKIL